ncbi:hypothetical protein D3C81_2157510 [compost metagenome]
MYEHTHCIGNSPWNVAPVLVQKCNLKRFVERSPEERASLDAKNERARQRRSEKRIIENHLTTYSRIRAISPRLSDV